MRFLAATGFVLVCLMQVVFIATAAERPFPYVPVQIVSLVGSALLVAGAWRAERVLLLVGFGINAFGRVAQIVLGLSRLPLLLNFALAAGWVWAAVAAARGRSVTAAVWFLAIVHAVSLLYVLGRFTPAIGLALGAAGLLLAAPMLSEKK